MDKSEAISKCSKSYKKYLDVTQVVFVYRDENNLSSYTEVFNMCNRRNDNSIIK